MQVFPSEYLNISKKNNYCPIKTYINDLTSYEDMVFQLTPIANELVRRIEKNDFKGRTLVLKVKYSDFRQTTHSYTGNSAITDSDEILEIAANLLTEVDINNRPVRLLGLTVTGTIPTNNQPIDPQLTIDW